jgi:hypothetical protein
MNSYWIMTTQKINPKAGAILQQAKKIYSSLHCLLFASLLLSCQSGQPATVVPCGVPIESEEWTSSGSPYLINCDVQVDSLAIGPGVTVLFLSNSVFRVTGFLKAIGTAAMPVQFTSTNAAVGWQGILFTGDGSALAYCTIERSKNSGVRIKDCVVEITSCLVRQNSAGSGGGINIDTAGRSLPELRIADSSIADNVSSGHGGGINALMGNNRLRVVGCVISNNAANPSQADGSYVGGGVRVDGDSVFTNCRIIDNACYVCEGLGQTRAGYGGGVYSADGDALFKNCVITDNLVRALCCSGLCDAQAFGGGIYLANGSLTNINCIIALNTSSGGAGSFGSGIYISSGKALTENCTIIQNSNQGIAGSTTMTTVRNSIFFFNAGGGTQIGGSPMVTYSDVQGTYTGTGNKNVDPSLGPTFRITLNSPCVDMGDPESVYNDLCFPPSRGTSRNDIGAHGGPGACCWDAPCSCPVVAEIQGKVACAGINVSLCVAATGPEPLSYQWRYHGANPTNSPMTIANATTSCLPLTDVQSSSAGYYSVLVSSPLCSTVSNPALLLVYPVCFSLDLYPGISVTGEVGHSYCIQYTTQVATNAVWTSLTNVTLSTPNYFYRDPQPARSCESSQATPPQRFYRIIEGTCP